MSLAFAGSAVNAILCGGKHAFRFCHRAAPQLPACASINFDSIEDQTKNHLMKKRIIISMILALAAFSILVFRLLPRSRNSPGSAGLDNEATTAAYSAPTGVASNLPSSTQGGAGDSAAIGGCPMFPADNVWNTRVDSLPVDPESSAWINSIGSGSGLHMDFGSGAWDGGPIGIPYNLADGGTPKYTVSF